MDTLNIDAEKCTACRACQLACSFTHEGAFRPRLSRIRVVRFLGQGLNVPVVCVNCARPACVEVCPTGAAHIDRGVPVARIDEHKCIGCRDCIKACPFGAADFHDEKEVAFICDLCDDEPACVDTCIYGALSFEPVQTVAQRKRRATAAGFRIGNMGFVADPKYVLPTISALESTLRRLGHDVVPGAGLEAARRVFAQASTRWMRDDATVE